MQPSTLDAFAAKPFELQRLSALAIGFAGAVELQWCYFQRAEGLGVEAAEKIGPSTIRVSVHVPHNPTAPARPL